MPKVKKIDSKPEDSRAQHDGERRFFRSRLRSEDGTPVSEILASVERLREEKLAGDGFSERERERESSAGWVSRERSQILARGVRLRCWANMSGKDALQSGCAET